MTLLKKIVPFFFLLLVLKTEAQQIFQKTYDNPNGSSSVVKSFVTDAGGNIYMTGGTGTFATNSDCLLMKTDSNGTLQWTKLFGDTTSEGAWQMGFTIDSNLIIGAWTMKFNSYPDENHPLLIKADTSGSMIWGKVYVDSSLGCEQTGLLPLPDSGFLLTGTSNVHFPEYDSIPWYAIMIRLDSSGNVLWSKTYGVDSLNCNLFRAVLMEDGGFLTTGFIYSKVNQDYDIMLMRTDSLGNLQWAKRMIMPLWDFAPFIFKMYDDNYLLAGYSQDLNTTGIAQVVLFKIDSLGNILWTKWYGSLFGATILDAIAPTKDNGFIFSQHGFNNFVKIDSTGNIVLKNDFQVSPFNTAFSKIQELPSGGFLLLGQTGTNVDVYLSKIDSTGNAGCYQATLPFYSFDTVSYFNPIVLNTYAHNFTVYPFTDTGSIAFNETVWCNTATYLNEHPFTEDQDIEVFPNPVQKVLFLKLKNYKSENCILRINDITGRTLQTISNTIDNNFELRVEHLNNGVYIISVSVDGNYYKAIKFIKF